jgi:hypothetical protein
MVAKHLVMTKAAAKDELLFNALDMGLLNM